MARTPTRRTGRYRSSEGLPAVTTGSACYTGAPGLLN